MAKKDIKKPQPTKKPQPKVAETKVSQKDLIKRFIYIGIILIITFISYSDIFKNDFIRSYDDKEFFVDNPYINGLTMDSVKTIFSTPHWSANYIPLTTFNLGYRIQSF